MDGAYQNTTAHNQIYVRRQSIIFEYQVPQLHTDNNLFHFTELRFQDFRLLLYIFVIIRPHYSEHRHSRLFLTEIFINMQVWKRDRTEGSRHTVVADSSWCQPPFSQLSWVFVFSPNVLARSLILTSATQKPFQDGMIKTETNVAVAPLSWVLGLHIHCNGWTNNRVYKPQ